MIWYIVLDKLYEILDSDVMKNKIYCKNFLKDRMRIFSASLIEVIPLRSFLQHVLKLKKHMRFYEYRDIILKMFANRLQENSVLSNANSAIFKVNSDLFH